LRLSNQVVEEVQKHFNDMVFDTIIQRNVKLSEAPSFGESIINMQPAKELQIIYI
jgi:chromosome partitioning protein